MNSALTGAISFHCNLTTSGRFVQAFLGTPVALVGIVASGHKGGLVAAVVVDMLVVDLVGAVRMLLDWNGFGRDLRKAKTFRNEISLFVLYTW